MIRSIIIFFWCIGVFMNVAIAQINLKGRVIDSNEKVGVEVVNIYDKDIGEKLATTDGEGYFNIGYFEKRGVIVFKKYGYHDYSIDLDTVKNSVTVFLKKAIIDIEEVEVYTGYQNIPRDRASGSFVQVSEKELMLTPGSSILDRLDGIMPGLQFDRRKEQFNSSTTAQLYIRGMNSFNSSAARPLIVVDNFPYEGDLSTINPNDVASVTMLRDAAATSIWGARAGNGVLVITMKKTEQAEKAKLNMFSSVSIVDKPDLYYMPHMKSSDFVDVELFLYDKQFYHAALKGTNAHRNVFSPVVQASYDFETGKITRNKLDVLINDARKHDYRDDLLKYFYKKAINQRYHFSFAQGTAKSQFLLSAGYDINHGHLLGKNKNSKASFRFNYRYEWNKKFSTDISTTYTNIKTNSNGGVNYPMVVGGGKGSLYPYARLIDENGKGRVIEKNYNLNFVDTVAGGQLLDWSYNPYEDIHEVNNSRKTDHVNANFTVRYKPVDLLSLELIYNTEFENMRSDLLYSEESYFVRDLVNQYSQITPTGVARPIPIGAIRDLSYADFFGNRGRFQLRMDEAKLKWGQLSWIIGGEVSVKRGENDSYRSYGFDINNLVLRTVNYVDQFPMFLGGFSTIPSVGAVNDNVDKMVSFYANASYVIDNKYIISGSARRDASNVFGVKTNDRWNPLWSFGLAWNADKEKFLSEVRWLSKLKIRGTYGVSGNLAGTTNDRVIIRYVNNSPHTGLPYAPISSPPNPSLKWEDIRMMNLALDFGVLKNRIYGALELYQKRVSDLISLDPIDFTTGFSSMNRNVASIRGQGFDVMLTGKPLVGDFSWDIGVSLSYSKDVVTSYKGVRQTSTSLLDAGETSPTPILDKQLYPMLSYPFLGLDKDNGDPLGSLEKELSKDYAKLNVQPLDDLIYHGSAVPLYFGFVNNTFRYKNASVFVNVAFRAGHYFRKSTVVYGALLNSWDTNSDYEKRWQKPGDEDNTTVPSINFPMNASRDLFYKLSSANVEKGDVIRLQQISFSYDFVNILRIPKVEARVNVNNLGVIWRANKSGVDPDFLGIPPAKTFTLGFKIDF